MTTLLEREIYTCDNTRGQGCWVWDPDHQPSVRRNLERDPNYYAHEMVFYVTYGVLSFTGGVSIPMGVDMVLCRKHVAEVVAAHGVDNDGWS